ncbi:hypothetical protein [Peterkaempfera sp. SMS 1(5)a]|uniref:hypothetical protein n=1 Tax=Peterkaempfera podocarpi TaxID=3232308 RepID=UPI00366FA4DD
MIVTLGCILLGVLASLPVLVPWWRGGKGSAAPVGKGKGAAPAAAGRSRDVKSLIPWIASFCVGALASTCSGGVIGNAGRWIVARSGSGGDTVIRVLTGAPSQSAVRSSAGVMTAGAAVLYIAAIVTLYLVAKKADKGTRLKILSGAYSGITLGGANGIAGLVAAALLPALTSGGGMLSGTVL